METIVVTSVEFEQETIPMHMLGHSEPDPDWRCEDHHGDERSWDDLVWVTDSRYRCNTCEDWHEEGHWEIKETGDRVEPGYMYIPSETRHVPSRQSVSGTFVSAEKPPVGETIPWKDCGWSMPGERPDLKGSIIVTEHRRVGMGGYEGRWVSQGLVKR